MSQNILQIYTTNPAASMIGTDLLYLGRSPYGVADDFGITWNGMQASITALGTVTTGVWNGSIIGPAFGGSGVNNGTSTLTLGGNLTTTGAFASDFTMTGPTNVTFPTSGTLATVGGMLSWIVAPSTPITATVNTGYMITDASTVTITLPVTAPVGSIVAIAGTGAGGWVLAPGAGQTIKLGPDSASTSVASAEQFDCIEVICTVANTTWIARSMVTQGFTYV